MAFANTVDERYSNGDISNPAGANDAAATTDTAMVLAPNDSAYGALVHDGAADVDVYALGELARGRYTITVLNETWDAASTEDAGVLSISLLDSTGAVLGTSTGGGLEVEVYDASEFYLRIDGGDHGAAQYRAFYTRTGDVPPDHAFSDVTYTLSSMQLDLTLTGSAAIDGTGNALDNNITGNAAANTLRGEDGNDWLDGAGGFDSLFGGAGDDVLGGAGVERMEGGAGDDAYLVNDARDRVVEASRGGVDVVHAEVSHALAAMVENLVIDTGLDVNGSGNGLGNSLSGGSGANRLWGLEGSDALHGFAGNDRLDGGAGVDGMHGGLGDDVFVVDSALDRVHERRSEGVDLVLSSASFTLANHVENLTLTGSGAIGGAGNASANQIRGNDAANSLRGLEGDDLLIGLAGNDRLDGGAGVDALHGGLGDDVFVVDSRLDRVHERWQEGVDQVRSSVSFTLANHVENLTLTGSGAIGGGGNASANQIRGNDAANSLDGGDGADLLLGGKGGDRLAGGSGKDQLFGGSGADVFVFNTIAEAGSGAKRDAIADFDPRLDMIRLSNIDADASARGNQAFEFIKGARFTGDAGELRYKSGLISGDVNGDGEADFQIALLDGPSLTAGDFIL